MRPWFMIACLGMMVVVFAQRLPAPGSPAALTDWRWLARAPEGVHGIRYDVKGEALPKTPEGAYLVLKLDGPGVMELLATSALDGRIAIEADGQIVWSGPVRSATHPATKSTTPFQPPLTTWCGNAGYLAMPVAFRTGLRVLCEQPTFPCWISYRTFPKGTTVEPATADAGGAWQQGLSAAAERWNAGGFGLGQTPVDPAKAVERDFLLPAGSRTTALALKDSGEITRLEFHCNPALVGTLREVVVEIRYDGAAEPAVRLPLPDFCGLPHPWPLSRWDCDNATLAGGVRYPWYIHTPRIHFPEATFYCNLPLPFAKGIRVDLVNRSDSMRFSGYTRAIVAPLSEREAQAAGRLCAQRTVTPLAPGTEAKPLLQLPGAGQLVTLGLYTTGGVFYPPAARSNITALTIDETTLTGPLVLPIWFNGAYGGASASPLLNHPRYEQNFTGLTRAYVVDPIPFATGLTFAFTTGSQGEGAATDAIAFALWYRFAKTPFVAAPLPPRAEALSATCWGVGPGLYEAEELVPLCAVHGGEARVMDDAAHDYAASSGKYLLYSADQPGDYLECRLPMPASPYVAIGTATLWGPVRGSFEADLLSIDETVVPPGFAENDDAIRARAIGGAVMRTPIMTGTSLSHRRDPSIELIPFRNPAPDGEAVVRVICQAKPLDDSTYLFALDRLQIASPPPAKGWREFEEALPETAGGLTAVLPKYGSRDWSGWGAVTLTSPAGGSAIARVLAYTGPVKAGEVHLKGCLGPAQGGWSVRVNGGDPVPLTPGKTENEVVEWTISVPGLMAPGPLTLEFACTKAADLPPRAYIAPPAELDLDCWMIK